MPFLYPMWDGESQRLGVYECTPAGYKLRAIAELIGVIGLFGSIGTVGVLVWHGITGTFHVALLWWIALPIGLGVLGELLMLWSWRMACQKSFHYDDGQREASWIEDGERRPYR